MPKLKTIGLVFSCVVLASCAGKQGVADADHTVNTLDELKNLAIAPKESFDSQLSGIRRMAIQETAMSLGAQTGLAQRSKQINNILRSNTTYLDKIFDFNQIILKHNVLPPVLLEGRNTLNLQDTTTIRLADRTYRIVKQARFVTTPPNWREYLWLSYQFPERPHHSLLPKNATEVGMWNAAAAQGWKKGVEQAESIYSNNLARIRQDYLGMVRYRKLLAQGVVSPPYVAKTELGITGGGNELHVDDRVLRISALPQLLAASSQWDPALAERKRRKDTNRLHGVASGKFGKKPELIIGQESWRPLVETAEPEKQG